MRESLVNMENSRTFADATKTVVSHSVRANGNRSRHQVVSLFYRPSVSRTPVVCPQTAAVQKDSCALRGTAVFVATGRAAVPLLNRLVKKGYYAAGRDLERQDMSHGDQSPCVARPRIIHQLNIPRVGLRCGLTWSPGILFSPASVAAQFL